ncbi:MFS transporter [Streptomyces sp. NPDC002809]|uniref:MFS transporter n=1 Tax=Streptomyces sp. NPDC002809 TaxID=3154433 RepID=UPI00331DD2DF
MSIELARPLWRNQQFALLASARAVSVLGNGFARVALAFAVLALPGAGPGRLSLVLACQAVPQLALVLLGGVIADRMSRSRLMAMADVVGAVAYGGLAVLVLAGHAPLPLMCVLAVAAGTATALFAPAMDGMVPLVVPAGQLQQANGLLRVSTNVSLLLGLALSGITVAWLGAGWALALNALSFVISAVLTSLLAIGERPRKRTSGWADLREGWQEFSSRQWLWAVVCQCTFVVAALNANVGVLGPLAAEHHLGGARAWAVIVAAQALGAVAGAGLAARVRVERPVLVAVLALLPSAVPIVLLGLGAPVWLIAVAMFGSGVSSDVFGVLWSTTVQREVPEEALSRVSSYDLFGSLAFAPLGLLLAGPAAAAWGTDRMLFVCAALIVAATSGAVLVPQVRTLRSPARAELPKAPDQQEIRKAVGTGSMGEEAAGRSAGPAGHE